jgi:hypothetical protein
LQSVESGASVTATADSSGRKGGVYFFFETGEVRSDTGINPRVVRVGTHAITTGSRTTLWRRLAQHRGANNNGGGNHRGSIFRLLVGTAIQRRDGLEVPALWDTSATLAETAEKTGQSPDELRRQVAILEEASSACIRQMLVLWVAIDDPSDLNSDRGKIERNAVALLSNLGKARIDPSSAAWLGQYSDRDRVRRSGLWNNNHVEEAYDSSFLKTLEGHVFRARPISRHLNEPVGDKRSCALAGFGPCSDGLSREHYISAGVLRVIAGDKGGVRISGTPWSPVIGRRYGVNALAARIC